VTSRDTGRWVIPKGWPIAGEAPHASAAREALEEAGVVGEAGKDSIGTFTYAKRLSNGAIVICEVQVFPPGSKTPANGLAGKRRTRSPVVLTQ
jgi:8-oxo-dGTP pyrophosphatase MutT (NUDIX family)